MEERVMEEERVRRLDEAGVGIGLGGLAVKVSRRFTTAVEATERVCAVAGMFGLGVDEAKEVEVVPEVEVELRGGEVVFVTGASGGGKTVLMRLIGEALRGREDVRVIEFGRVAGLEERSDKPVVEALDGELEEVMGWLAVAGLNEAFVMLRKVGELSDGQRYRFGLAEVVGEVERGRRCGDGRLTVVLADEFGSTLDRVTAHVVGRQVSKWVKRSGVCFVAVSAHEDLEEALRPGVVVVAELGGVMEVMMRPRSSSPRPRK